MQTLGTDWGRKRISPDIWANAMAERISRIRQVSILGDRPAKVIIDDVRFPNDWAMLKRLGGTIFAVRRPAMEQRRTILDRICHQHLHILMKIAPLLGWTPVHETEYHWPDAPADFQIWNYGNISQLHSIIDEHLSA
jgi:hypothetical protein